MDDIAEKIGSLLADEESMRQIKELAAMLSNGDMGENPENGVPENGAGENFPPDEGTGSEGGGDFPNIDFGAVMGLMGAMSQKDKNCDLLVALRPHLCPERQGKIDRAVKLLKLYNVFAAARESGLLNDLGGLI
ncbi:MAG: hypothetical protein NC085_12690 [Muribaculaceae bacterium]|nr:hypothetical protein [Muribaculaceae bacterium]